MVLDIPFGQSWSAIMFLSSPIFMCIPSFSESGRWEKPKCSWLSISTTVQQLEQWHVISIILIWNSKHSTMAVIRRKMNYIQAETKELEFRGPWKNRLVAGPHIKNQSRDFTTHLSSLTEKRSISGTSDMIRVLKTKDNFCYYTQYFIQKHLWNGNLLFPSDK